MGSNRTETASPGLLPSGDRYAPPPGPVRILHQDDSLVAVEKPSGLLTVPGRAPWLGDCLEHRLRALDPSTLLLHRLDLETSGVLLFARSPEARRHIARQFNKSRVHKEYQALVWGRPAEDQGTIDAPLICDWPNRPRQKVCFETGRPSRTEWQVLAQQGPLTRLQLHPTTGRTHQLRVHLRHLGHPIAGDRFYATGPALTAVPRLALHAAAIRIRHPEGGAWVEFRSPVPF